MPRESVEMAAQSVNDLMPNPEEACHTADENLPHIVDSIVEGARNKDFNW
jgi:hypothetical protein